MPLPSGSFRAVCSSVTGVAEHPSPVYDSEGLRWGQKQAFLTGPRGCCQSGDQALRTAELRPVTGTVRVLRGGS